MRDHMALCSSIAAQRLVSLSLDVNYTAGHLLSEFFTLGFNSYLFL